MAFDLIKICDSYDHITDWIWPRLTKVRNPTPDEEFQLDLAGNIDLADITPMVSLRLSQVEDRDKAVDTKLIALLTLLSVLSVAVAAILTAVATFDRVDEANTVFALSVALSVFYAVVQIVRALWSTINGLTRRGYLRLHPRQIIPRIHETNVTYRVRLLDHQIKEIYENESVINEKVSQMALAHTALRNALFAAFLIIAFSLIYVVVQL